MSKYRPVDVRVWNDRKFLSLSSDARLLWLFLLTTPSALPIPGVVIGGEGAISEQLGWTVERYRERFQELLKSGLSIRCEGRTIWLENALRYQPPCNPNMVKAWAKAWDDVPESPIKLDIWKAIKIACKSWTRLFDKLFPEPFGACSANGLPNGFDNGSVNGYTQDQDQKQDQDLEDSDPPTAVGAWFGPESPKPKRKRTKKSTDWTPEEIASAKVVLEKLTAQNDVQYTGADAHLKLIIHQLRGGVSEMDMRAVIGYCAHELGWKTKPEMLKYLRPETLFGPQSISKYLDPARAWFASLPDDRKPNTEDQ